MKRIMRAFKLNEISAVDRPAQAHAKVVLMKRDFSASERRSDAKSGAAMPDGSFPIENAEDLANARRLAGKAKDPAAARAHIARRAKALGLSKLDGLITEYLNEDNTMDANDLANYELQKAVDAGVEGIRKEFEAKLAKSADELAKAKEDLVKASMTDDEWAFYQTLGKADNADEEADKKTFREMSAEDRKKKMKKAMDATIPDDIRKQREEAADMKKRLAALEDDRAVESFAKRATDIGLEGHGETLRKAYAGNAEAIVKLESLFKGLTEQIRTGKVFAEFGSNQPGTGATAADEMKVAASAYREGQVKLGKKCTPEQAFTAIYTDPVHAELKKRYDAEEIQKRRAA
jgi:hypothetical protein